MGFFTALASSVVLLVSPPQDAPEPTPGQVSSTELESIVVHARRVEEAARAYVEQIGEPPRGTHLARWNDPVCISMTNMQPQFAQFVIDRIAVNALEAGAEVGEPGCRPNVIIFATMDGPGLARRLVDEAGLGFRPAINHTNLTRDELDYFQNSDAPVRWWNVVMPVIKDTGEIAIALRGESILDGSQRHRVTPVRDGSRLRSNVRYSMAWTIIIIDMSRTDGAPFGLLADYVSMVSLAQVDPQADHSDQSTVMNLFRAPESVDGLSQWDRDFLAAVYAAPADRMDSRQQENAIIRSFVQQRREREGLDQPAGAAD